MQSVTTAASSRIELIHRFRERLYLSEPPDCCRTAALSGASRAQSCNLSPLVFAGALAGLVAALAMTLLLLVLRATLGLPTPSEMIGDRLTAFISITQFFALLDQFGGYSGLKQAGGGGVVAAQLVVGTLGGISAAALVTRRQAHTGLVVGALVGALWLLTIGLLWPNLGTNYRGLPPDAARLATSVHLLVCYSVYGIVLAYGFRALNGPAHHVNPGRRRRSLLLSAAAVTAIVANGALLRQFVQWSTFDYDGTEYRGDDVQPITPNERFYTVTKNIVDPSPLQSVWRLEIAGLIDRPRAYTYDDIRALPATTQETTLMCISNYLGGGLMSNAVWTGLPLRDLLLAAGPRPGPDHVGALRCRRLHRHVLTRQGARAHDVRRLCHEWRAAARATRLPRAHPHAGPVR